LHRGGQRAGEALVPDEDLGVAVADDVRDLRAGEVMVDRRQVPACLHRCQEDVDHRRAVRQDGGERVALLHPDAAQPVHETVRPSQHLARRVLATVGVDERDAVGVGGGEAPEAEIGHGVRD
jgi:hypothetical protein